MSVPLLTGLILQGLAALIVARRIRHRRLAYNGLLFVAASVLYHGIGECLQRLFPGAATYREHIDTGTVDRWVLIVGSGILLFALAYSYRVRPLDEAELEAEPRPRAPLVSSRWMLPAVLLAHASVSLGIIAPGESLWQSLVLEFLPALTAIALVEFSDETAGRHSMLILTLLCVVGALSGQRGAVLLTSLLVMSLLVRDGWDLPARVLRWIVLTGALLAVLISAARAEVGRVAFRDLGFVGRVEALGTGFERLVIEGAADTLLDDFVYRVDGNTFGALALAGYEHGVRPGGWRSFSNNFYLVVPSALNPAKLDLGPLRLDEENYLMAHFGMPGAEEFEVGSWLDYLPSFWGVLFADVGTVGMLVCAALLGWAFAMADSRCVRTRELGWVLVGYWLTASTITLEQGFRQFFTLGRSTLVLAMVLGAWRIIGRQRDLSAGIQQDEGDDTPAAARADQDA